MNIFYLHQDPATAASFHCDKHCVKMILESAQLLSTAHRVRDGDDRADELGLYKSFSPNHPCAVWARTSRSNYRWLYRLLTSLCREYEERYGKLHAVQRIGILEALREPPKNLLIGYFSNPPQCMPDQYKVNDDPIQGYRNYYLGDKARFARWQYSSVPDWWAQDKPDKRELYSDAQ